MGYQHQWHGGAATNMPVGKLVCVGRNYAAHARELGNEVPDAPIIFLKPSTSAVALAPAFSIPKGQGECHYETEITLLIGQRLSAVSMSDGATQGTYADYAISAEQARTAIAGIGLGLDLTLREKQNELKAKGQPWELAKAFDGSAPLSCFLPVAEFPDLAAVEFSLSINGERRQNGHSADMITDMIALLQFITRYITLLPGDVVMTGTPAGVAALHSGDALTLQLADVATWQTRVL
jgi:2-keto-4-pentenoate hydratase/2-oxohepta-3-ene-1,7-dioic acid hydratase in catechol pathway